MTVKHHLLLIVLGLGGVALLACTACTSSDPERANSGGGQPMTTDTNGADAPATTVRTPDGQYQRPSDEVLRQRLTELQWRVTQEDATERAFNNEYWDNHEHGIYVDITTGEPLFSSLDKFDSGTGWPSFCKPIDDTSVVKVPEGRYHEVRSEDGDAHLGHLFPDGPSDRGGMRYCINSAAIRFIGVKDLAREGYGTFVQLFVDAGVIKEGDVPTESASATETVIVAGGCFWGMEELLRAIDGVVETEVGYSGGNVLNATYDDVKRGSSGHAEAVRVVFKPDVISLEKLLTDWFFRMHDPTTANRQGNDRGSQYRSAIFYANEAQRQAAERAKEAAQNSGRWDKPIVTEIAPAGEFWSAEGYHQDYLQKNPGGYTCHWLRD